MWYTLFVALCVSSAALAASVADKRVASDDAPSLEPRKLPSDIEYEVSINVYQTIFYRGYPVEEHKVVTTDGYKLTMYRIPGPKGSSGPFSNKKVVFLMHGLLDSSFTWVCNLEHQSLAFILADRGYDVWLGNARGNTWSRDHVSKPPSKNDFWQFTFNEMGYYDMPAMLNYVLTTTNQPSLSYVGHSQGGMIGFIAFSAYPELAAKINVFVGLAPATNIANAKGGLTLLAPFASLIDTLTQWFGNGEFLPTSWFMEWLAKSLCGGKTSFLCSNILFMICGYDSKNINETRLPVYIAHTPAGTSSKNMQHFAQLISSKRWQKYDNGKKENKKVYGSEKPPEYDISTMTVPTAVFYSRADWLVTTKDVEGYLLPRVKNLVSYKDYQVYQHLDFVWSHLAYATVYKDTIDLINTYSTSNN